VGRGGWVAWHRGACVDRHWQVHVLACRAVLRGVWAVPGFSGLVAGRVDQLRGRNGSMSGGDHAKMVADEGGYCAIRQRVMTHSSIGAGGRSGDPQQMRFLAPSRWKT
jgi:hypothetical protein